MASESNNDEGPMVFTNYTTTLYKRFSEMFQKKELTDAILICENQRIHVHKFLLSASSSFFNKMFKKPHAHSIHINNVKYADLLTVLEYMYKGEVGLQQDKVAAFLDAAKKLSIRINSHPSQCDDPETSKCVMQLIWFIWFFIEFSMCVWQVTMKGAVMKIARL